MHELGLTRRLLEVVLGRAGDAGPGPVTDVYLELGEEADVAAESVGFYWPEVSRGTRAEGARLVFSAAADPFACRVTAIEIADDPA